VNAGVLMAPVVPGFTTERSRLEATIRAIADHGAAFLGANVLYLKGGTRDHFMGFLRSEYPHLVDGYERLYPGAYASKPYTEAVKGLIGMLRDRYDNGVRIPRERWSSDKDKDKDGGEPDPRLSQEEFDWEP